jgi:TRAP-type C4-dicarboxylate transport system permease small subunit
VLTKAVDVIIDALAVVAGLLLLFITFSISYTILARFVDLPAPVWVVQFNEYALLWMTFLGAAWLLKRGKHVSIDLLTSQLSPRRRPMLDLVHSAMGLGLCGVLFWYAARVTWGQFQRGVIDVQAVDVPKSLILLVIPLGFLLLDARFLLNLLGALRQMRGGAQDHQNPSCMAVSAEEENSKKSV